MSRLDARRNRDRIVAAAAEVFREHGATAPLGLVAERAGVGRATLYRHFPDRRSLAVAVLDQRMTHLEGLAAAHPGPDRLERLLVEIWAMQLDAPGLIEAARSEDGAAYPQGPVTRTRDLLLEALDLADRHGAVRPGVGLGDLYLVIAMLDGVIEVRDRLPAGASVESAMGLAIRGLRPAARLDEPLPAPSAHLR